MASMTLADAVLRGTEPERRVSCEWHKSGTYGPRESYTVTVLEDGPESIWRTVQCKHFASRAKALSAFARVVDDYWTSL